MPEPEIWIEDTARRHGITDDDIRHAVHHPSYTGDDPDTIEEGPMTLLLGPDRAGTHVELAILTADDGTLVVVHAMKMRQKYQHLLPQAGRRGRRSGK